jgi:hypothetical protein
MFLVAHAAHIPKYFDRQRETLLFFGYDDAGFPARSDCPHHPSADFVADWSQTSPASRKL